jgi:hypothetical protein
MVRGSSPETECHVVALCTRPASLRVTHPLLIFERKAFTSACRVPYLLVVFLQFFRTAPTLSPFSAGNAAGVSACLKIAPASVDDVAELAIAGTDGPGQQVRRGARPRCQSLEKICTHAQKSARISAHQFFMSDLLARELAMYLPPMHFVSNQLVQWPQLKYFAVFLSCAAPKRIISIYSA